MSAPFKTHGPSRKQLNVLFACLFGFPLVMGLGLALQGSDWTGFQSGFEKKDAPVALSASAAIEPRLTFQDMLTRSTHAAQTALNTLEAKLPRFDVNARAELTPEDYEQLAEGALSPHDEDELVTGSLQDMVQGTESPVFAPALPIGQELSGKPDISDAIILSFGSARMRLAGLEAPPLSAECKLLSGEGANCREAASQQLGFFLSWRNVNCQVTGTDEDGMPLGQCRLGGSDIGEWLVRRGWASPVDMTDPSYRAAALFAQSYRLGQYRP